MDNIEIYTAYLAGEYEGELPMPRQIRAELYLAHLCGLDVGELPPPRPIFVELFLYQLAENGGIGGVKLPELLNAATADQILAGYEAINQDGLKVTGTMPDNGAIDVTLDAEKPSADVPAGYHNGAGKVSVVLEEKTVTPGEEAQEVTPSAGKVLGKVTVEATQGGGAIDAEITDAGYLFYENRRLGSLDALIACCKAPVGMDYMFYGSNELVSVDLSGVDTSNVSNMDSIFTGCANLEEIIGFSASGGTNTPAFPQGDSSVAGALRRLTFRTDLPEDRPAIISGFSVAYDSFQHADLLEMFNTLPLLPYGPLYGVFTSASDANKNFTTNFPTGREIITIFDAAGVKYQVTAEDFSLYAASPVRNKLTDVDGVSRKPTYPITMYSAEAASGTNGKVVVTGNPGCSDLTDSDRLQVTSRGWTLVE